LKRSNRLVLLIGVFLALVAFVGVIMLSGGGGGTKPAAPVTEGPVVVAVADIPLSAKVTADQVAVKTLALTAILPGAYTDPSQVVGKVVRQAVTSGAQLTGDTFAASTSVLNIDTPAGLRAIPVQVDQVTGVGTVIKTGDYVDMVVGFAADKLPVTFSPPVGDDTNIPSWGIVKGINNTSVKVLLQGMQVLGTLLPPPTADTTSQPAASGAPQTTGTTLNGQQEIVILAVTPQQVEVIKFAQLDGSISLVLRSADDFIDPATGKALPTVVPDTTTGVILKLLVDTYGVLPPELVTTVAPPKR
jgi:Flp pilus assembly protein CpaB